MSTNLTNLLYRGGPEDIKHSSTHQSYSVRNYSIVGNFKVGFPQWRAMRCQYPETGPSLLQVCVYVVCVMCDVWLWCRLERRCSVSAVHRRGDISLWNMLGELSIFHTTTLSYGYDRVGLNPQLHDHTPFPAVDSAQFPAPIWSATAPHQ